MGPYHKQAIRALEAYHERSVSVIKLLERGKVERALSLCRLQKAAFYNFKGADATAILDGKNQIYEQFLEKIWEDIPELERKIIELFEQTINLSEEKQYSLRKEKNRIGKYRSQPTHNSKFEKSV